MEEIISKVREVLKADSELMSLLQGVYLEWAPERSRPYATIKLYDQTRDHNLIFEGPLEIDIWDDGPGKVNADNIRKRCIQLLHGKTFDVTGSNSIRLNVASGGFMDDEDPSLTRYNLAFNIRGWQQFIIQ